MVIFSTASDFARLFEKVESRLSLKYTQAGRFKNENPPTFNKGSSLPNLGIAKSGDSAGGDRYLVSHADNHIASRLVSGDYVFDEFVNDGVITITLAGIFNTKCLISSRIDTSKTDGIALSLKRRFYRIISKDYVKISGVYVGPEARLFSRNGYRLAMFFNAGRSFDLPVVSQPSVGVTRP